MWFPVPPTLRGLRVASSSTPKGLPDVAVGGCGASPPEPVERSHVWAGIETSKIFILQCVKPLSYPPNSTSELFPSINPPRAIWASGVQLIYPTAPPARADYPVHS